MATAGCIAFLQALPLRVHNRQLRPQASIPVRRVRSGHPQTPVCNAISQKDGDSVRDFLTQRAVQQTVFCAFVLRDETTARWLEAFLGHTGLHDLHACNALRLPSSEYLTQLFRAPPEVLKIHKPIIGRTNRKNPYLKRRYLTYDVDIVPRTIALRVLDARLQIAEELKEDVGCLAGDNERLLRKNQRRVLTKKESPESDLPSQGNRGGSPYREATFDLLKNYTLQQALTQAKEEARRSDAAWLESKLEKFSAGLLRPVQGERNVADGVVSELFQEVPYVRNEGRNAFFDPCAVVDRVLELRLRLATGWLQVVERTAEEHLDLEKKVLENEF